MLVIIRGDICMYVMMRRRYDDDDDEWRSNNITWWQSVSLMSSRPMTTVHAHCTEASHLMSKMRDGWWTLSFYALQCFVLLHCISLNGIQGIEHGQRISILEPKRYSNVSLYDRPMIAMATMPRRLRITVFLRRRPC